MGYRWQCVEHGEIIRLLVSPRSPPGPGPANVQKASVISDQPHGSPSTGSGGHSSARGPSV